MAKKFNVKIVLDVNDATDGKAKEYFRQTVEYADMPIEGVLMIEDLMVENARTLTEIGKAAASNSSDEVSENLEVTKALVTSLSKKK